MSMNLENLIERVRAAGLIIGFLFGIGVVAIVVLPNLLYFRHAEAFSVVLGFLGILVGYHESKEENKLAGRIHARLESLEQELMEEELRQQNGIGQQTGTEQKAVVERFFCRYCGVKNEIDALL